MKRDATILLSFAALLGAGYLVCPVGAAADAWADYQAAKQKALAPLQADYDRIIAARKDDPAVQKCRERVGLVDEVALRVLAALDALDAASAAGVAAAALTDPDGVKPVDRGSGGPPVCGALCLLAEYGGAFVDELPPSAIPQDERAALREYVSTGLKAAALSVAERGRIVHLTVAAEDGTRQVVWLVAILPLLGTSDGEWTQDETESLPEWVRRPSGLAALEGLALQAHRPLTASVFSQHVDDEKEGAPSGAVRYLQAKGREARASRDFAAAVQCFRAGASVAEKAGDESGALACLCQLAETLSVSGDHAAGAAHVAATMARHPDSPEYGRLVVLRMKYLYRAEDLGNLWQEAQAAREEERCQQVLPELLYVSWLTARRLNRQEAAGACSDEFLKRFPEHPWCADMYFHSALVACVSGDSGEMERLFGLVRERFPRSEASEDVKRIGERLLLLDKARKQDLMVHWRNPPPL